MNILGYEVTYTVFPPRMEHWILFTKYKPFNRMSYYWSAGKDYRPDFKPTAKEICDAYEYLENEYSC